MAIQDEFTQKRAAAYVDGELSDEVRAEFERAMVQDEGLRREVAAQRALRDRIAGHFAPVVDEPVPEGLRALLGEAPQVIDFAAARARREEKKRLPAWGNFGAIAATLVVGLIAGQMVDLSGSPVASRDGQLVAQAGLERALDVQLASAQPADAAVRIGVTFREPKGAVCRSFESAAMAGIACRSDGAWQLRQTVAPEGGRASDYRQAGSANAAMMQAAQAMMAGEPLDTAAERKARDAGWR
jgi:hypothetical protein